MSDRCTPAFRELAARLDGVRCEDAHPIGYLNDPTSLDDWAMPLIELVMIGGAIAALVHAIVMTRRHRDATGLGVWLAAVVYVVVLEPPLYFPEAFGIEEHVHLVFVHNEFTVGLLYDRMPLYILLLYPCLVYLAWSLVARWRIGEGRPRWRAALITAACVGFVHHTLYEVFDMLGPLRGWWAWNDDVPTNHPALASVPWSSIVNFALVMPAAFALLAVLVIARRPRPTATSVLLPAVAVGVLTPLASAPGQVPATLLQVAPELPDSLSLALMLALLVGFGAVTCREAARVLRRHEPWHGGYAVGHAGAYLAALVALWAVSLPRQLDGGPLAGSLPYVVACFAGSAALVAVSARTGAAVPADDVAPEPVGAS